MKQQALITGIGQVSSLGTNIDEFWSSLSSGKSGLARAPVDIPFGQGRTASFGLEHKRSVSDKVREAIDSAIQQALVDAKLTGEEQRKDITIVGASNFGSHFDHLNHGDFFFALKNVLADLGLTGEFWGVSTSCASGGSALGLAHDLIHHQGLSRVLVCAYDVITSYNYGGMASLRALSPDHIRPFDKRRNGTLLGEGVATFLIESATNTNRRPSDCYAEILGHATANDAYHFTAPHPEGRGMQLVMSQALHEADILPDNIGCLKAHGTGTIFNDRIETMAVQHIFGKAADRVPVTSLKSSLGHTMGAAGALEGIAALLGMGNNLILPILFSGQTDNSCRLKYVFDIPSPKNHETVMCNSYGLWGTNSSFILKKSGTPPTPATHPTKKRLDKQYIVIAGLGSVSASGIGGEELARAVLHPHSFQAPLSDGLEFKVSDYAPLRTQCLDPVSAMALTASSLACRDAGWGEPIDRPRDTGLVLATARGNQGLLQLYKNEPLAGPLRFVHTFINTPAGLTAQVLNLQGAHSLLCSGDQAGSQAIRQAVTLLVSGKAQRLLCGGVDTRPPLRSPDKDSPLRPGHIRAGDGAGVIALEKHSCPPPAGAIELAGLTHLPYTGSPAIALTKALQAAATQASTTVSSLVALIKAFSPFAGNDSMTEFPLESRGLFDGQHLAVPGLAGSGASSMGLAIILACQMLREMVKQRACAVYHFLDGFCTVLILKLTAA